MKRIRVKRYVKKDGTRVKSYLRRLPFGKRIIHLRKNIVEEDIERYRGELRKLEVEAIRNPRVRASAQWQREYDTYQYGLQANKQLLESLVMSKHERKDAAFYRRYTDKNVSATVDLISDLDDQAATFARKGYKKLAVEYEEQSTRIKEMKIPLLPDEIKDVRKRYLEKHQKTSN